MIRIEEAVNFAQSSKRCCLKQNIPSWYSMEIPAEWVLWIVNSLCLVSKLVGMGHCSVLCMHVQVAVGDECDEDLTPKWRRTKEKHTTRMQKPCAVSQESRAAQWPKPPQLPALLQRQPPSLRCAGQRTHSHTTLFMRCLLAHVQSKMHRNECSNDFLTRGHQKHS